MKIIAMVLLVILLNPLTDAKRGDKSPTTNPASGDILFDVADGLSLVSFRVDQSGTGSPIALAVLDNQSDNAYENPYILVTLLDEDEDVIGEITVLTLSTEIPAHSLAPLFGVSTSENEDALLEFSGLEFGFVFGAPRPISGERASSTFLTVDLLDQDVSSAGSLVTEVRVTNTGSARIEGYDVVVMVLDDNGEMVGFGDQLSLSGLRPDQSSKVTVS